MTALGARRIDVRDAALLVVDVQYDFLPGGALPVPGGDEIIDPLGQMMAQPFRVIVATQDWHPSDHMSFASRHPGRRPFEEIVVDGRKQVLWPDHCIQGRRGAELHAGLPWERASAIIRKGTDPNVDSYSGFRDNWSTGGERAATGLAGYLRERNVRLVMLCGLARDVCVKWSAEDAAALGFDAVVLWDLTRPVQAASDPHVREDLVAAGVTVMLSRDLE